VIIEDNEPDSMNAEDEAKAASDDVAAITARRDASLSSALPNRDPAFELNEQLTHPLLKKCMMSRLAVTLLRNSGQRE
jgi:hypothetical protein